MIELNSNNFNCIIPLLAGIKQAVLPYAICENINPGRVFVDKAENPCIALIWTPVGYYFLAGEPGGDDNLEDISKTLLEILIPASKATGETGLILIPATLAWKEKLPALLPGRDVSEIYRRPFIFDPVHFAERGNWRGKIPHSFTLRPVDAELAEQTGILASWASVEDFLKNGIGFALLDGNEIASYCISVFANQHQVEIDVHTNDIYKRRGFATITASALIEECLLQGKQPNWECFWKNETSTILANKIGFNTLPDYPVYFWEEAANEN